MSDKACARPTARARELRANATDAERRLWQAISARKVAGTRFNRQVPIEPYIVDFVSRTARLVVEVDGGQHGWQGDIDTTRTRFLESRGFRIIRFWDHDVMDNLAGVVADIARAPAERPSPDPSRQREGSP